MLGADDEEQEVIKFFIEKLQFLVEELLEVGEAWTYQDEENQDSDPRFITKGDEESG